MARRKLEFEGDLCQEDDLRQALAELLPPSAHNQTVSIRHLLDQLNDARLFQDSDFFMEIMQASFKLSGPDRISFLSVLDDKFNALSSGEKNAFLKRFNTLEEPLIKKVKVLHWPMLADLHSKTMHSLPPAMLDEMKAKELAVHVSSFDVDFDPDQHNKLLYLLGELMTSSLSIETHTISAQIARLLHLSDEIKDLYKDIEQNLPELAGYYNQLLTEHTGIKIRTDGQFTLFPLVKRSNTLLESFNTFLDSLDHQPEHKKQNKLLFRVVFGEALLRHLPSTQLMFTELETLIDTTKEMINSPEFQDFQLRQDEKSIKDQLATKLVQYRDLIFPLFDHLINSREPEHQVARHAR